MAIIRPVFNWVAQPGITPPLVNFTRNSTASYTDALGVIRTATYGVLRDAYNPLTGAYLGKLIEEQRTNLLLYSSVFDNAAWAPLSGPAITPNTTTAPDGTTTAYTLADASTTAGIELKQDVTIAMDTAAYCASLFIKKTVGVSSLTILGLAVTGGTTLWYRLEVNTTTGEVHPNTTMGSVGTPNQYGIIDHGDYWRVYVAGANNGTNNIVRLQVSPCSSIAWNQPAGDVAQTGSIQIWGAQVEAGTYPTSYIPTTTAAATRSADVATVDTTKLVDPNGNPRLGGLAATQMMSWSYAGFRTDVYSQQGLSLGDGTTSNQMVIGKASGNGLYVNCKKGGVVVGTVTSLLPSSAVLAGVNYKVAVGFDATGRSQCMNGEGVTTNTTPISLPSLATLSIGHVTGVQQINGMVSQVALFNRRLSGADLQALTA